MIRKNHTNFASGSGADSGAPARLDMMLFMAFLVLVFGGIIMVYGASSVKGYDKFADSAYFFKKQILFTLLGFAAAAYFFRLSGEKIQAIAGPLMVVSIVLVFAVMIPGLGRRANGATRWLNLGPFGFQPFELAKFAYVLFMAGLLSDRALPAQKVFTRAAAVTGMLVLGLMFQKDFGGTVMIFVILTALLFVSGAPMKILLFLVPAGLTGLAALIIAQPYRIKRLLVFLDPWKDYNGAGWQSAQSLIAIGSGGITGNGLGNSMQKYQYLPEAHTDYIFSIIGEELGLIGGLAVLAVLFVILYRGMLVAVNAKDNFLKYTAAGITVMFIAQALINIGVAVSVLPAKGMTLPFLSYGGSSVLISFAAAGVLLSVSGRVGSGR